MIGVLIISSEYATGSIRATLAATPSRVSVLAAKAIVLFVATLAVGEACSFVSFFVGQAILRRQNAASGQPRRRPARCAGWCSPGSRSRLLAAVRDRHRHDASAHRGLDHRLRRRSCWCSFLILAALPADLAAPPLQVPARGPHRVDARRVDDGRRLHLVLRAHLDAGARRPTPSRRCSAARSSWCAATPERASPHADAARRLVTLWPVDRERVDQVPHAALDAARAARRPSCSPSASARCSASRSASSGRCRTRRRTSRFDPTATSLSRLLPRRDRDRRDRRAHHLLGVLLGLDPLDAGSDARRAVVVLCAKTIVLFAAIARRRRRSARSPPS